MSWFAAPYTIHFDDTMAYGSHHFLTSFKFQCAGRESLLFGRWIFGQPGVAAELDTIHLLTGEAYTRNLRPARLGERLVVLATVEERGLVSMRFCFRVLNADAQPISCGFQTILCADATRGELVPFPPRLAACFETLRAIEEPTSAQSFRSRVLEGGAAAQALFSEEARASARLYLATEHPAPDILEPPERPLTQTSVAAPAAEGVPEAWIFSGQGTFSAALLSARIAEQLATPDELGEAIRVASAMLGEHAAGLLSGDRGRCEQAARAQPALEQVGIFVQSLLGARQRLQTHAAPRVFVGHSFGEIAALAAAGSFDLADGVRIVCDRVAALAHAGTDLGGLLAVALERHEVRQWIDALALTNVVVAGRNYQTQTVVSGPTTDLATLASHLDAAGIGAVRVTSPAPFHHPMLRPAADHFRQALQRLSLRAPQACVYSPIGRRIIDGDLPLALSAQLVRPFDFHGALADLRHVGIGTFVDCGTTGKMQRLMERSLGADVQVVCVGMPHESTRPSVHVSAPAVSEICQRPPIAILGGGCLLPGGATDPRALFDNIQNGVSGIVDLTQRDPHWAGDFLATELTPDRSTSSLAGMVRDSDLRVPAGLSPETFAGYDRAQRILAVALAQCKPQLSQHGKTRCLIGSTADGYETLDVVTALRAANIDPREPEVVERLGVMPAEADVYASVSRVVADVLGDHVEVVLVDAACASSLYCVALGMRALETGDVDTVVAGGIFSPGPGNSCLFSQFRGLSATGVHPFDASADGVVFGEGGAFVTLRRLIDAERDASSIAAVLRGAGLASDGLAASANVPRSRGQVLAMARCHRTYALDPADVEMVEAHGTGTPVGDSTELRSLKQFFAAPERAPLIVRSLKALLGHTGWAAGSASILATCEAMRRGVIAPQANYTTPSAALADAAPLLSLSATGASWRTPRRRAAVNGFGFGGADAQVVLEAYQPGALSTAVPTTPAPELVVVAYSGLYPSSTGGVASKPSDNTTFDRSRVGLPAGVHLLPDLAEDMDVTQALVLHAVHGVLGALPDAAAAFREDVALIVVTDGKSERGVDATLRVLEPRLVRELGETTAAARIQATAATRPVAGAYTLQGMMPNVAAGRAASRLDLAGPNFVVDAGRASLSSALDTAALTLGDSARLVVVTTVCASKYATPSTRPVGEALASFAVTTQAFADALGLPVLGRIRRGEAHGTHRIAGSGTLDRGAGEGADELLAALGDAARGVAASVTFKNGATWAVSPADAATDATNHDAQTAPRAMPEITVHEPVWVEAPAARSAKRCSRALFVAPRQLVRDLIMHASVLADDYRVVVPGSGASADARVLHVSTHDEAAAGPLLQQIEGFAADIVVTVQRCPAMDLTSAFDSSDAACDLLALAMLVARGRVEALERGAIELVSLSLQGVDDRGCLHPASGGAAGMLKSLAREFPRAVLRPLVASSASLADGLAFVAHERSTQQDGCEEIAEVGSSRRVRRLRSLPPASGDAAPLLTADSVVIATGGARGVTAVLAEALLRRYGCTVVALGRSKPLQPPPGDDAAEHERAFYAETLLAEPGLRPTVLRSRFERQQARWESYRENARLSALPGRFVYVTADITQAKDTQHVVDGIIATHGDVALILHGAGVQYSGRLARRRLGEFRQTLDVKLTGLKNLQKAIAARQGAYAPVHALTSAYSYYGNDGQPDYGAANETLDRLCALASAERPGVWQSIGWLAWAGVGMTRGSEYAALATQRHLSAVDAELGTRLFLDVIDRRGASSVHVQLGAAERERYNVRVVEQQAPLDPQALPCLRHHLVRGRATLPGAFALERFVNAIDSEGKATKAVIEGARFSRFVRLGGERDSSVNVKWAPDASTGWWVAKLEGDIVHASGHVLERDVRFCEARVRIEPEAQGSEHDDQQPRISLSRERRAAYDPYCKPLSAKADHGVTLVGPFACLNDIEIGDDGRQAVFVTPAEHLDCAGESLPALLLDATWRLAAMHPQGPADTLYVPVSCERITVARSASETSGPLIIRATAPQVDGDELRCSYAEVVDQNGRVHLRVHDAIARRVG